MNNARMLLALAAASAILVAPSASTAQAGQSNRERAALAALVFAMIAFARVH